MTRESSTEAYLRDIVRRHRGLALKLTGVAGIHDRLLLLPGGVVRFIELKTLDGPASPIQIYRQQQLTDMGFSACLCRSREQVRDILQDALDAARLSAPGATVPPR